MSRQNKYLRQSLEKAIFGKYFAIFLEQLKLFPPKEASRSARRLAFSF
jgi:hypothetical protein